MDRLSAPEQNAIGAYFADLLRKVEQDSGPEFLPRGLDVMGLVRQLALPSAETVEKLSYGDPLFRMPTQSNIPITTDRGYVAEVLGMAPAVPPAARATTRISNEVADQLVKAITRNPDATAVRALDEIGRMSPVPQITTYHGSPSLFREFDPSADPMGRKRNAYGYGAGYTTESKDVANLFKEKSSVWTGEEGYLYKGEIPDELLGGFLKWDEPIKNQTKEIRELAKRYGVDESDLGGDLVSKVGKTKEGTDVMLNSGITGIEYKKFGDEPSNYVVFRTEDFRIQEINDIPIEDYYARGLLEPEAATSSFKVVQPGDQVSGLTVREEVPNMGSISATLDDYEVLSGIREVPRGAFDKEYLDSLSFEKLDKRTKDLANQINESKEINPMIVGVDSKGAYIIEGGHRFDALMAQDTKSIPAMVVIDKSDPPTEDVLRGLLSE
jgi:hypothetical protein